MDKRSVTQFMIRAQERIYEFEHSLKLHPIRRDECEKCRAEKGNGQK